MLTPRRATRQVVCDYFPTFVVIIEIYKVSSRSAQAVRIIPRRLS